jgi:hypothetical protein
MRPHSRDKAAPCLLRPGRRSGSSTLPPLQEAKVGFVSRQTAGLGLAGALRMISPVVRSILAGANAAQLRLITRHMRQLM